MLSASGRGHVRLTNNASNASQPATDDCCPVREVAEGMTGRGGECGNRGDQGVLLVSDMYLVRRLPHPTLDTLTGAFRSGAVVEMILPLP